MESNTKGLSAYCTLDPTKTFDDVYFIILALWAEENLKSIIGTHFGMSEGWANKHLALIYKTLKVNSLQGCIDKAWYLGIFTTANRDPDAPWRKRKFFYADKRFFEKKES